jgi:hypothetical protein
MSRSKRGLVSDWALVMLGLPPRHTAHGPCHPLKALYLNNLLQCTQIGPDPITIGDVTRGLDKGWGAGATMAEYPSSPEGVRLHPPTKRRVHSHS